MKLKVKGEAVCIIEGNLIRVIIEKPVTPPKGFWQKLVAKYREFQYQRKFITPENLHNQS